MLENEYSLINESSIEQFEKIKRERKLSEEFLEIMLNQISNLYKQNQFFYNNIEKLNQKVNLIEEENKSKKILIENQKKTLISYEKEIKEIKLKINSLETYSKKKKEKKLKNINCKKIHNDQINLIKQFPSGKLISTSNDNSIKIFNENLDLIQNIKNAHEDWITYLNIKDENNFVSSSYDESIITWLKKNDIFEKNIIIENAHNHFINKVIYCSNDNIISCSWDKDIKIWEKKNNKYYCVNKLDNNYYVKCLIFLEENNNLISSGREGTKIWDLNNINNVKLIKQFHNLNCFYVNNLKLIDNDKLIIGKFNKLKIISISQEKIIKEIKLNDFCYGIKCIRNKDILLIGCKNDILLYDINNFNCIQIIKNAHCKYINGFVQLRNGNILSFSDDFHVKIWTFDE